VADESSRGVRADCERTIGKDAAGGRGRGRGKVGTGEWGERKFTEAICC